MRIPSREHLSFANVVSVVALFVGLGGTSAVALDSFDKKVKESLDKAAIEKKILNKLKGDITSAHLDDGGVKSKDLADDSIKAQSGGIEAARISAGYYVVKFPVDMTTHGITANRQSRDPDNQGSDYTIVISRCGGGPAGYNCAPVHNTPDVVEVRMDKVGNNPDPPAPPTLDDAGFILSATP